MLKQKLINLTEIIEEETKHCIALASIGDKLLTVSAKSCYAVCDNGIVVYSGNNVHIAIEKYNGIKYTAPTIERKFIKNSKRLHQLIN